MDFILISFFVGAIVAFGIIRVFLAILSRKLKKKLGIDFKINKLGLFQLKNVTIEKNDQFLVEIKKISLSSRWMSGCMPKPLTIVFGPVNVILTDSGVRPDGSIDKKEKKSEAKPDPNVQSKDTLGNILVFLLQYIGLQTSEITILHKQDDISCVCKCQVQASFNRRRNDPNDRTVGVSIKFREILAKVTKDDDDVIADVSFALGIEAATSTKIPVSSSSVRVDLSKLNVVLKYGVLSYLAERKSKRKGLRTQTKGESSDREDKKPTLPSPKLLNQLPEEVGSFTNILPKLDNSRFLNFCVAELEISLEDCRATYINKSERQFSICWHSVLSWRRSARDPEDPNDLYKCYSTNLDLDGLVVNGSNEEKLLLAKQIECSLKLTGGEQFESCLVSCTFDTLHTSFIYEEIKFLSSEMKEITKKPAEETVTNDLISISEAEQRPPLSKFPDSIAVEALVKVSNCSCDLLIPSIEDKVLHSVFTGYLGCLEVTLKSNAVDASQKRGLRGGLNLNDLYTYLNVQEMVECRCLSAALPCVTNGDKPAILPTSEQHVWGRFFELGKISLQMRRDQEILSPTYWIISTVQGLYKKQINKHAKSVNGVWCYE